MNETEFWGRPVLPKPICVDRNMTAERARIVREALWFLYSDPRCCELLPMADRQSAWDLAHASDDTLAKLGALLK